jgi:hypothetical protein
MGTIERVVLNTFIAPELAEFVFINWRAPIMLVVKVLLGQHVETID